MVDDGVVAQKDGSWSKQGRGEDGTMTRMGAWRAVAMQTGRYDSAAIRGKMRGGWWWASVREIPPWYVSSHAGAAEVLKFCNIAYIV